MKYSKLGSSGVDVSRVCLGSMTWGQQNTQQDADEQIDYAMSKGINFIDTAELYAVPPCPETYGRTEQIIGDWLSRNTKKRKELIIASKIAGPGLRHIRGGSKIDGNTVKQAVDDSLKRLQTDYIDLYQLHWPNRTSPHFGQHRLGRVSFSDVDAKAETTQMLEILQSLDDCVKAGKIRYCGLSDDTTWGINTYLKLSDKYSLPKMVSIQNEFNLLHSKDWPYLIENCVHEDIAFLPWSPLATGMLSGKYIDGQRPAGSRWTIEQRMGLFRDTKQAQKAVVAYKDLAERNGITAAQLALAWCDQVDGVTSTIIGATTMSQLKDNIAAFATPLSSELLQDISKTMRLYTAPF